MMSHEIILSTNPSVRLKSVSVLQLLYDDILKTEGPEKYELSLIDFLLNNMAQTESLLSETYRILCLHDKNHFYCEAAISEADS